MSNGGAPPARRIYGQASLLSRTIHDVRYNEVDDEIVVPSPFADAILTFRGGADGQEAPIRIIQGGKAQVDGSRLAIDAVHQEIFAFGRGGIQVFPLKANGDVAPIRVIAGSNTMRPNGSIAVDPINNVIATLGQNDSILFFNRTDNGNVKPRNVIQGPNTQIDRINQIQVHPESGHLIVAMPGQQGLVEPPRVFVGVWNITDNGDVAPKYRIYGNATTMKKPFGVALNPVHKEIYVSDMRLNGVVTFSMPELFEPSSAPRTR
jgi:DNA-binding beta-propeller fold protein YncE